MPVDGLMLSFIKKELQDNLLSGRVDKIQQPEKAALLFTMRNNGENHKLYISASAQHARMQLTALSYDNPSVPPQFLMVLRKHLGAARLISIEQYKGDRIIDLEFDIIGDLGDKEKRYLIIEIMGRHSNIIFTDGDFRIIDSIVHVGSQMSRIRQILPGYAYQRPPLQDKLPPDDITKEMCQNMLQKPGMLHKILSEHIIGLSPQSAREIAFRLFGDADARSDMAGANSAENLHQLLHGLQGMFSPTIAWDAGRPQDVSPIDITSTAFAKTKYATLGEALDVFYRQRDLKERIEQRGGALYRIFKSHKERCERKIALQMEAILDTKNAENMKIFGELITAYQYQITKGDKEAILDNYYAEGAKATIPLDTRKTPNENAQMYFKRYQKMKNAAIMAKEQLTKSEKELSQIEGILNALTTCTTEAEMVELREEAMGYGLIRASHNRKKAPKFPPSKPLHFLVEGFHVYVGKNNNQNERLTKNASPDHAWMHVKDMPGSHVIIESEISQIPEATLRACAQIAAYYSKGRESGNVPVDMTMKKFVKKPPGTPLGYVTYTNNKTLYVNPKDPLTFAAEI